AALRNAGVAVGNDFFDTLHITGVDAAALQAKAVAAGYNLRVIDAGSVGISLDETATRADIVALGQLFGANIVDDAQDSASVAGGRMPGATVEALDASTAD